MADEPTLGELGRRLDDRITDVRDDIAQLGRRIDDKVDTRIHQLQYDTITARVTTLESLRAGDAARVAGTRRWMIGAVIVPIVAVVLAYLLSRGGSA